MLRLALAADGESDRALLPIIKWLLRDLKQDAAFYEPSFVIHKGDFNSLYSSQVASTLDILFVHRDAEGVPLSVRRAEIPNMRKVVVRIVPVRMTEAWLLIDPSAIRRAADNPNGRVPLSMPPIKKIETLGDPKSVLRKLLENASERPQRRMSRFRRNMSQRVLRIAEYVTDFTPLRGLDAFKSFEGELRDVL